jgi:hypothetical protein
MAFMTKRPKRPRDPIQLAKLIGDNATGQTVEPKPDPSALTESSRRGGLKGGNARADKLTPVERKSIALSAEVMLLQDQLQAVVTQRETILNPPRQG